MKSTAKFTNVKHMAEFCAILTKNGVHYDVVRYTDSEREVQIWN